MQGLAQRLETLEQAASMGGQQEYNGLTLQGLAQRMEALERENAELRHEVAALRGSGTGSAEEVFAPEFQGPEGPVSEGLRYSNPYFEANFIRTHKLQADSYDVSAVEASSNYDHIPAVVGKEPHPAGGWCGG